jgi:hypothetical protein
MIKKLPYLLFVLGLLGFGSMATTGHTLGDPRLGDPPPAPKRVSVEGSSEAEINVEASALFLPSIQTQLAWVNTASRAESQLLFRIGYLNTENVDTGWRGDLDSCNAGTTSENYRAAVLRPINYFRGMAGVPEIRGFDNEFNAKAQAAALMMSLNVNLSHTPPPDWECYSKAGSDGAGSSNLALGYVGTDAISHGYLRDDGVNNFPVGHRRWILYPQTQMMGTGDIPPHDQNPPANALWVIDHEHYFDPRPATRDEFVAWPPPGYVPFQVVYPRWSFSHPQADFSKATVTMTRAGQGVNVKILPVVTGSGENTLVWEPQMSFTNPPAADTRYVITVGNVLIGGRARSFSYAVIVFDPGR